MYYIYMYSGNWKRLPLSFKRLSELLKHLFLFVQILKNSK